MTRSCVMVSSKKASRISRSRSRPTRWRGRCAPCWTGLDAPPPPCGSPGTASIHHSGRPRGSDVRGDQIRASFIHFASGCTLHNPGTPGYLRAPMAESVASNLAAVQGITVGHWTDLRTWTGCTVVLAPVGGMRAACALRGRATGTREIDALDPRHLVGHIDAVLRTGGSAYGPGAAGGGVGAGAVRGGGVVGGAGVVRSGGGGGGGARGRARGGGGGGGGGGGVEGKLGAAVDSWGGGGARLGGGGGGGGGGAGRN